MKKWLSQIIVYTLFFLLYYTPVEGQNALTTLGLTSTTPAASSYSLRKMSSAYSGPLVRITIGTNYYDVYPDTTSGLFAPTSPISAAMTTYNATGAGATVNLLSSIITSGTTTATVAIWYDQSGSANNVIQATTANQPRVINLGTIETLNGKPTLRFVGASSHFMESVANVSIAGASSVNAVSSSISSSANTASIVTTKAITAFDGSSSANAALSAAQLKIDYPTKPDGVYWIDLPTAGATQIYCIMDSAIDGGGWMLAMKATTGTTFSYASTYWTAVNTLNPTEFNRNNGDAKYNVMNYFQAKDMMALWPDIASNYGSSTTGGSINLASSFNNWCWLQNSFYGGTRVTPISFFATSAGNNKYISDAALFAGKGTAFSSQTDVRFYGYNYVANNNANFSVRWGFGWNENGGGLYPSGNQDSNDVSGGIGMGGGFGKYSAGDKINCCQNSTGINRSARVEVYIR
jgi:hypothetical protein